MSDWMLLVELYMERRPLTEEWLHGLLFRLWERGLHYNYNYAAVPLTWEEELHVLVGAVVGSEVYDAVPLSDAIQRIAAVGAGSIKVYDKELILYLFFDPSGKSGSRYDEPDCAPTRFGQIGFTISGSFLNTDNLLPLSRDLPIGAYLLAPYQQVMQACAHWMEVLCEECNPIFSVGYDTNRESAEEDERETIEAPLFEGRLPEQSEWRSLTYISARFIDNDFILSLLEAPGRWLKRMKDGGILMHTPYNEYAYESAEAYRHAHQGEAAKEQHEFALATQQYKRALGIFRSIPNSTEEWQSERDIASVDSWRRVEEEELAKGKTALFADQDGAEILASTTLHFVPKWLVLDFMQWLDTHYPEIGGAQNLSSRNIMRYVHEFERDTSISNEHTAEDWTISLCVA